MRSTTWLASVCGTLIGWVPLSLPFNRVQKRCLVTVGEGGGIKGRRFVLDQLLSQRELVLIWFNGADLLKISTGLPDFGGIPQGCQHHSLAQWRQRNKPFSPCHDDPTEADLAAALQRFSENNKGFFRHRTVRTKIVGRVQQKWIKFVLRDELGHLDTTCGLQFERLQLGRLHDDEAVLFQFISFDHVLPLDVAVNRADELLAQALVAVFVKLIEADFVALVDSRVESNRDRDQGNLE